MTTPAQVARCCRRGAPAAAAAAAGRAAQPWLRLDGWRSANDGPRAVGRSSLDRPRQGQQRRRGLTWTARPGLGSGSGSSKRLAVGRQGVVGLGWAGLGRRGQVVKKSAPQGEGGSAPQTSNLPAGHPLTKTLQLKHYTSRANAEQPRMTAMPDFKEDVDECAQPFSINPKHSLQPCSSGGFLGAFGFEQSNSFAGAGTPKFLVCYLLNIQISVSK